MKVINRLNSTLFCPIFEVKFHISMANPCGIAKKISSCGFLQMFRSIIFRNSMINGLMLVEVDVRPSEKFLMMKKWSGNHDFLVFLALEEGRF